MRFVVSATEKRLVLGTRKIVTAVILAASAIAAGFFPYKIGVVVGESMTPTMKPHQPFVIDKSYYTAHVPERGEVAIFSHNGRVLIKRVVGMPGDTICMLQYAGTPTYRQLLSPDEVAPRARALAARPYLGKLVQVHVPAEAYFMVGDGGPKSVDSRDFGPVPAHKLLGKVVSEPCRTPVNICSSPKIRLIAHR